jgi:hypothetical protein
MRLSQQPIEKKKIAARPGLSRSYVRMAVITIIVSTPLTPLFEASTGTAAVRVKAR